MLSPILSLENPILVRMVSAYSDGTIWFSFEDNIGKFDQACIDGRSSSITKYRLFDQARHPNSPEAVLIDLGSFEEGIIVSLVSCWLGSHTPQETGITAHGRQLICDTLIRIGTLH